MTNNVAIVRKTIYTLIYLIIFSAFIYYIYDRSYSFPLSGMIFSVLILPISILIFIRKIIQYIVYVLSVYDSDIEFTKYKDTKSAISEKGQKIVKMSTLITLIISFIMCVYAGFSALYLKEPPNSELMSEVTLSNLSNIDCDFSDSNMRIKDLKIIWPAKMYKDLSSYSLTGKRTKDGDKFETGRAHLIFYNIKNFPKWYLKVYFKTAYEDMFKGHMLNEQEPITTEINGDDYYGYCVYKPDDYEVQVLIADGHNLVYISVGAGPGLTHVYKEKVINTAASLLKG